MQMRHLALAAALTFFNGSAGANETITVVNNGGTVGTAQREAFFSPFTKESGISVTEDIFNQEISKLRSQVETGNLTWDVVSLSGLNEAVACEEGLIEHIDWSSVADEALFRSSGGFTGCSIPNNLVSGGLVYDADKIADQDAPKTWQDFWNVDKWPGKRGMLYRAESTLEVALMADGVPPSEVMTVLASEGGTDRAFKKLEELRPYIKWWKSGDESMQSILTGEVVMTYAWNGRVANANKSNKRNLRIVYEAGHVSGSQYFAVVDGSAKKDTAIKLISFSSTPRAQADYSRRIDYAPANEDAYKLMSEEETALLPKDHLDKASMQSGDVYNNFWLNEGDALLQRFLTFAAQR